MMNPMQLKHTAAVLADVLTFRQPADAVVSAYFRRERKLGRQDRHEIAETVFAAVRHGQKISAVLFGFAGYRYRAMSVSISLDNGTQLSMGIKIAFGDLHIMRHGIKIDLGPRAPVDMIHKTKPTFTKKRRTRTSACACG